MSLIRIIIGSTRPQRFGPQVANWLNEIARERAGVHQGKDQVTFEILDLAEVNLPLFDEPIPPGMNQYQNDHTKAWSKTVAETDGFLIVAPEYNNSINAALKNALDYVFYEWHYKPVAFASYGSAAGGSRAVAHLRDVAGEMRMFDLREVVVISNYWNQLDGEGTFTPTEDQTTAATAMIDQLIFWTNEMKDSRERLAAGTGSQAVA